MEWYLLCISLLSILQPSSQVSGSLPTLCSASDPGFIPHATDCQKYYRCAQGHAPAEKTCSGTHRWDINSNSCNHAKNVPCPREVAGSGLRELSIQRNEDDQDSVSFGGEFVADPNSLSIPQESRISHLHLELDIDFSGRILTGHAIISITKSRSDVNTTVLDAKSLVIHNIEDLVYGKDLNYTYSEEEDKLEISLPPGEEVLLKIHYSTTPNGTALEWLTPGQTAGKEHPYVFSQCEAIHCRTMLPCQDTSSVKFPYSAKITAPPGITVLMSAIGEGDPEILENGKRKFSFIQKVPVQSYLIALAAGAIVGTKIGPRSHVWSEKKFLDQAAFDFSETEKMLLEAEKLSGPYEWGIYDILLLPPTFPYGGMEHPCLTFITPSILTGDKSNNAIIAHEIAHSWTGNLVTNINFEHFWLNEGFTRYVEQKILGRIYGKSARHLNALGGWTKLTNSVERLGKSNPFTSLVVNLTGAHPDDGFSAIPYEKGSVFLWYLQSLVGENELEAFLRSYYKQFKYESISSETFKKYFTGYFSSHPSLEEIDWDTWLYAPGMPIYKPPYDTSYAEPSWNLATRWSQWDPNGKISVANASHFQNFAPNEINEFLDKLLLEDPLDIKTLEKMEKEYALNESQNVEIYLRWIRVGLKARWEEAVPRALKLVSELGPIKYIGKIYRDLYAWEEKREVAIKTFMKNEDNMMGVAKKSVRKDLHLD